MYTTDMQVRVQHGSKQYIGTVKSVDLNNKQVEVLWSTSEGVDISANFDTDTKQILEQDDLPDPCYLIDETSCV